MYLKEVQFKNYGALRDLKYNFQFNDDGTPKPTVFMGKNGTGKTLLLSNIVHSLIEMKRKHYRDLADVKGSNYYRMGSQHYICDGENFSYGRILYDGADFTDLMIKNYDAFKAEYNSERYKGVNIYDGNLKENGFYSNVNVPNENIFTKEIFLYFPVERYYIPTWENVENDSPRISMSNENFIGRDDRSIIKYNVLEDIESWILEVIIDCAIYEKNIVGKNTVLINKINELLRYVYMDKYSKVAFEVTPKQYGHRCINVVDKADEKVIVPKLSNFSSGEMMIFGMMTTILKECDKLSDIRTISFKEISGIVLVDEIDLHLHSDLLKVVLPNLIAIFPKIQFIVTSHSPFFLLGMKEKFIERCSFVTLPTGTIINKLEMFDEFASCYSIVDDNYNDILTSLDKVKNKLNEVTKPLIITEGRTDWKHIEHALIKLKENGEFKDLDVEFLRYDYNMGDSSLESLLIDLAKVPHEHKIIGVFDCDDSRGKKYVNNHDFGNNVHACCIKDVRGYGCGISIELLYDRSDLKIEDSNGRRIYLTDEFEGKVHRLKTNPSIICTNDNVFKHADKTENIKVVDSCVFDENDASLALSKNEFADNVYKEVEEFSKMKVDGFRDILDKINNICKVKAQNYTT